MGDYGDRYLEDEGYSQVGRRIIDLMEKEVRD